MAQKNSKNDVALTVSDLESRVAVAKVFDMDVSDSKKMAEEILRQLAKDTEKMASGENLTMDAKEIFLRGSVLYQEQQENFLKSSVFIPTIMQYLHKMWAEISDTQWDNNLSAKQSVMKSILDTLTTLMGKKGDGGGLNINLSAIFESAEEESPQKRASKRDPNKFLADL
jgi:hypothetical protein